MPYSSSHAYNKHDNSQGKKRPHPVSNLESQLSCLQTCCRWLLANTPYVHIYKSLLTKSQNYKNLC